MPCVDRFASLMSVALATTGLIGCGGMHADSSDKAASASSTAAAKGSAVASSKNSSANQPAAQEGTKLKTDATLRLPPPSKSRTWAQVREQAAHRLVAANPNISYTGKVPDVLLAIPVFSIQLNGDGSIRYIDVMRYPHQARDTVEIAKAALRRAEPFGDVSHLPKPWRFNETFLFNDQRKFKPLTLDR